ncbi:MAG: hypothetical protein JNG83_12685, partial [Opitutaceae bacterium]|nr:hypothetical protein [Opitutaceae bacterium]
MKPCLRLTAFLAGLLLALPALRAAAPDLDARQWQLFIDDYAIARGTGLDRVVHHPRWRGVVISNDQPWESNGVAPIYFGRKPDGSFFAFYNAVHWVPDPENKIVRDGRVQRDRAQQYVERDAYATSRDGIHWEKPKLGLLEAPSGIDWQAFPPFPSPTGSSKENNLGVPFVFTDLGQFGQVTDPAKRFALAVDGKAYFAAELPDFIGNPQWRDGLTPAQGTFSTRWNKLSFWDPLHEEWVAIVQNAIPHWLPGREIARFASKDLRTWRSEIVLAADPADPHRPDYYDEPMMLFPFASDGLVFGLLSWIHTDRTMPDGGPVLDRPADQQQGWPWPKTEQNPYAWPWARKGANEMRITISRDGGRTWDRTSSRQAWIPHGTEEDSPDRMAIWGAPPVRVGDEDWFYIGIWDGDHLAVRSDKGMRPYYHDRLRKGQIALYTQKHHRYVSLRANSQRETLITKPFVVTGDTLQLNVDGSRGRVR